MTLGAYFGTPAAAPKKPAGGGDPAGKRKLVDEETSSATKIAKEMAAQLTAIAPAAPAMHLPTDTLTGLVLNADFCNSRFIFLRSVASCVESAF